MVIYSNRYSKRKRKRKGDHKYIWRTYDWKLPKPKEGNIYPGTGSTEGPKDEEDSHQDIS